MGYGLDWTIDEKDAGEEPKSAYDRVRSPRGNVANIFKARSLDPRSLHSHLDFYASLVFGSGKLTRRQREMFAVVVSSENDCQHCLSHLAAALRKHVKDERFIPRLADGPRKMSLKPKERAMIDYA